MESGTKLPISSQGQALPVVMGAAVHVQTRGPAHAVMWHVTSEKAMKGGQEPPCDPIFLDTAVFKKYWSCHNPSRQTLQICTFDCGM